MGTGLAGSNDFHSLPFAYSFHPIVSNRDGVKLGERDKGQKASN
jgi:hypothetical protein